MAEEKKLQEPAVSEEYRRFKRFVTALVAVPKSELYELEPKLKPKPRSKPRKARRGTR
jgi:hypothetical protein